MTRIIVPVRNLQPGDRVALTETEAEVFAVVKVKKLTDEHPVYAEYALTVESPRGIFTLNTHTGGEPIRPTVYKIIGGTE